MTQIATHNQALNAVSTLDAEHAHKRAREADTALARGQVWGPLHGVPFTLKDARATAGRRTTPLLYVGVHDRPAVQVTNERHGRIRRRVFVMGDVEISPAGLSCGV